ncbi:uncharacterized protein A4U43_C05F31070 [Asparagus officinalis]|uniref:RNA polymerase I-specific transcription initiation factor RRN3 n=1 Tax=Asparagus officinalis TaxID=4686 RepID=A0A5P1EVR7_ASPOF|nr:RNA polymerase I-specific transcription initiation factor RRN3-like [Asparagus officinalis]ONK70178.1 uncharacterized protein A4U43_C05F31070 [Asparagus officinalis]
MGMELQDNEGIAMEVQDDGEERDFSDAEAFSSVVEALTGVAMAYNMVDQSDRNQYNNLVSIVDPTPGKGPEEEALLVTALKALTGAISKMDVAFHTSLLSNIFSLCIWNYGYETRKAILELIISLAAVPDKFLNSCLHMLVSNFMAPKRIRQYNTHPRLAEKRNIYGELYVALHHIVDLVPLAPMMLKEIIDKKMPRTTDPKEVLVMFVECMLGLESDEIGEFLGSTLLIKVVELLVDLDVNINWEDIPQDELNKGIFDMELDVEENAHDGAGIGIKPETGKILKGNVFADKLDSLMVLVCEHLDSCASDGHLVKVFDTLAECFRRTVMNAYKSKFVQFVMFYACSLDPEICGLKFAVMLTDIFVSNTEDPTSRMSSVSYLASYLSRAKFVPSSLVASILKRLVEWCFQYCQFRNGCESVVYPKAHRVFYSGCQAVMYILCFRMRQLMDIPQLRSLLFHLPLEPILCSSLEPLKVCLPTIVHEFLRQAKAASLFKTSTCFPYDNLLESEFSKAFGGIERLDMFFPFDPYLLKESDRFMRPNFEFWSMVKTTYSNCNSEDEDEDLDALDDNAEHDNLESNSESDDEIEFSLSRMSITPKPAFHYPMAGNLHNGARMPARIRPSMSPED